MSETTTPAIRAARPADIAAVEALVTAAFAPNAAAIGLNPAPMNDDYAAIIGAGGALVAVHGTAMAGVMVRLDDDDALWLESVAVHPAHQGRGIGRHLIAHAEQEAVDRGHQWLRLYIYAGMTGNMRLYPKPGFEQTARCVEVGLDRVYFAKDTGGQP